MLELFDIIEDYINQIIVPLNWLMLFLIIGGGIYLTLISKANPLRKISQGFKLLLKSDNSTVGISRFQALSAVLAATVGLGNISGCFNCNSSRGSRCSCLDVGYCAYWCYN
jgi:AGCS family alanine or glycine:cation symporter